MSGPSTPGPPNAQDMWNVRIEATVNGLASTAVECLFYGFHVVLAFLLFLNYRSHWRQRYLSLSSSCLLFGLSTAIWAMGLFLNVKGVRSLQVQGAETPFFDNLEWARCGLFTLAMLFGDAILTWRVYVLYRQTMLWVVVPQLLALAVAIGLGMSSFGCMTRSAFGFAFWEDEHCSRIMFKGQQGCWVLSAFINISSSVLLGLIAWRHGGMMRRSGINKNGVLHILQVLAISSTAYCVLWVPLLTISFVQSTRNAPPGVGTLDLTMLLLQSAFHQLVGIYPTLVTYLTLQNSAIFGSQANTGTRMRMPSSSDAGPSVWNNHQHHHLQINVNSTVQTFEETKSASSNKQFLPISMNHVAQHTHSGRLGERM